MDFSALNPMTSNSLNLASRNNDFKNVARLLKKINPNCNDNRGWTCLHEAAANDSYESLQLILKHKNIRPLVETYEGHTALYVAVQYKSSAKTVEALLETIDDIVNRGSAERISPLHIACGQGSIEIIQLLLDYGAIMDAQDFDGDTPLHHAAINIQHEAITVLLHAGASPELKNESEYTAFHLACYRGCLQSVRNLLPFINDINQKAVNGATPLTLAVQSCNDSIVRLLLENGADPHIPDNEGLPIQTALMVGNSSSFKTLLDVTDDDMIDNNILLIASQPNFFNLEIMESILSHNFEPDFFFIFDPFRIPLEHIGGHMPEYKMNAPLNFFLSICEYIYETSYEKFETFLYLLLMRGLSVNAQSVEECPPLVCLHYHSHNKCFSGVFKILLEHGCKVDYTVTVPFDIKRYIPECFLASLACNPSTSIDMLPYSLYCDPEYYLRYAHQSRLLGRISRNVQDQLLAMIGVNILNAIDLPYTVLPLKHLCRQTIRQLIRNAGDNCISANKFNDIMEDINLPRVLRNYICFMSNN